MLENKDVKLIKLEDIVPNRFQPREVFGEKELNELASSIKEHGIIQPLILRPLGSKFEIIAGERRYKAANIAGLFEVPAIIVEKDDNESAELAIVENIQRKDLTPIEEARSYKKLLSRGLTQEEIAKKLGIAQSTVANKLRLLNLAEEVQDALLNNRISERHARGLLRIENPNEQINLLNRIINEKLTVKQTDEEIDKFLGFEKPLENLNIPVFEEKNPKIESFDSNIEKFDDDIEILEIPDIDFDKEKTQDLFKLKEEKEKLEIPVKKEKDIEKIVPYSEKKYEYLDTINDVREKIDNIRSKGIKISSEEYDMENEYQIIIRIEK